MFDNNAWLAERLRANLKQAHKAAHGSLKEQRALHALINLAYYNNSSLMVIRELDCEVLVGLDLAYMLNNITFRVQREVIEWARYFGDQKEVEEYQRLLKWVRNTCFTDYAAVRRLEALVFATAEADLSEIGLKEFLNHGLIVVRGDRLTFRADVHNFYRDRFGVPAAFVDIPKTMSAVQTTSAHA